MVTSNHLSASLRALDVERQGLRTFTGIRRDVSRQNVTDLLQGINRVMERPATNAILTVRSILKKDD